MSLLNYGFTPISKTATASGSSEQTEGTDHVSDEDSSDIDSYYLLKAIVRHSQL